MVSWCGPYTDALSATWDEGCSLDRNPEDSISVSWNRTVRHVDTQTFLWLTFRTFLSDIFEVNYPTKRARIRVMEEREKREYGRVIVKQTSGSSADAAVRWSSWAQQLVLLMHRLSCSIPAPWPAFWSLFLLFWLFLAICIMSGDCDEVRERLKDLVLVEDRIVTFNYLSEAFSISAKEAQEWVTIVLSLIFVDLIINWNVLQCDDQVCRADGKRWSQRRDCG